MSEPNFNYAGMATGQTITVDQVKPNFEAVTDWCKNTKLDNTNLQYPRHNVCLGGNTFGSLAIGTYYFLATIPTPPAQLAWVPIEAAVSTSALGGGTLTVDWQVWDGAAWVTILTAPPLAAVADMTPATTTAFVAPYSGGIANGTRVRAVVVIGVAAVADPSTQLFLKAYHVS